MLANEKRAGLIGVLIGAGITPIALLVAAISSGAGHGHYVVARLLFPIPMLITRLTGDTISLPSIALALAQFSLYGLLAGRRQWGPLLAVAAIHSIAVAFCFGGTIPNFS